MTKKWLVFSFLCSLLLVYGFPKALKLLKSSPKEIVFPVTEHKPFVVIIPSYNNEKWCHRNLRSALEQEYDNFRVVYINDASKDQTSAKVHAFIKNYPSAKIEVIDNQTNQGAMANFYRAIHRCADNEIVVVLDGDDWFAHEFVLERLNKAYANPNVWITYGSYLEYPSFQRGEFSRPLPKKVIEQGSVRKYKWQTSHLRTFYAALFKQIRLEDVLQEEGKFYDAAPDMATMFPMLEMAAERSLFLKDSLYIYNCINPISEDKVRFQRQRDMDRRARSVAPYARLSHLFSERKKERAADLVIFSFDRPLQLYALLESSQKFIQHLGETHVIYRVSSPAFGSAYEEVKAKFPHVHFLKQGDHPAEDFKPLLMNAAFSSPSSHVVFAVDDIIVKEEIDLAHAIRALDEHHAYGYYFRLGKHVTYCYATNRPQGVPLSIPLDQGVYAWQFESGQGDWRYPHTLDFTLYRKEEIKPMLEKLVFKHPNELEAKWAAKNALHKVGLYSETSKVVNIPLNLVNLSSNRYMHSYSVDELLGKFKAGLKIDITPFYKMQNVSAHVEQEVAFVERIRD